MPVLPLRIYGDPVLRAKAKAIEPVADMLRPFVLDLFDTMKAEDGVGLTPEREAELLAAWRER